MILLIDNFDSFSHNLLDYVKRFDANVCCIRYDRLDLNEIEQWPLTGILIGPGPGKPEDYPLLFKVVSSFEDKLPILGICLGHQLIGEYYGATLSPGIKPMHGKVSRITHVSHPMFKDISEPTEVTRYHSLVLKDLPDHLWSTAWSVDGENMAITHKEKDIWGIQFHPEAILTIEGEKMISNWMELTIQKEISSTEKRFDSQTASLNVST